jgi:hypothetical protein
MVCEVPIKNTRAALVDDGDALRVGSISWHAFNNSKDQLVYARGWHRGRCVLMHRFLLDPPRGVQVDHINGDTLDNRRENIRLATASQNLCNRRPFGKSGFKGVHRTRTAWLARIGFDGKSLHLGSFQTAEEAAKAYDAKAKERYGEFARLNFPLEAA